MSDDATLVAPCGLFCGACPIHRASADAALAERIGKLWGRPANQVRCAGCRPQTGVVATQPEAVCETYDCCVNQRKLDYCFQCPDFPCLKLAPSADRSQELPHNSKVYNLLLIQRMGAQEFAREGARWWAQYMRSRKPRPGGNLETPPR
ncbi:MAG: DUF3795 domain-containing protein [Chloroflexi bacterium]|nr:DUF3795 domain-containing protein [Chloroflexota bacterium]